jgi:hypothetical protein
VSAITGPDAVPRRSADPKLPKGASRSPDQEVRDGRLLVMLITPPRALRPYSALSGPRTKSIWLISISSRLDEFALSCGTPSM